MFSTTLACGPYFDGEGAVGSLVLFLLIKPLAYFAFIQAFRYRVSQPIPMRLSQAFTLTACRLGLSIVLVGPWLLVMAAIGSGGAGEGEMLIASWIFLYVERLFSWWLVGYKGASLRGRRLIGWIISGTMIGTAFDFAMVLGLVEGIAPQLAIVTMIAAFIAALHVIGQRESLRLRFVPGRFCLGCRYDLTGNLSGRCPECGHVIGSALTHSA